MVAARDPNIGYVRRTIRRWRIHNDVEWQGRCYKGEAGDPFTGSSSTRCGRERSMATVTSDGMPAVAAVETARYEGHQACLRRLPRPAVRTPNLRGVGRESPQGDLAVVAREFIRRAETRHGSDPVRLSRYSARFSNSFSRGLVRRLQYCAYNARPRTASEDGQHTRRSRKSTMSTSTRLLLTWLI